MASYLCVVILNQYQGMKKQTLLLLSLLVLSITVLASPTGRTKGEKINFPLKQESDNKSIGRPRSAEQPLFNACLDTELFTLFISSAYDVNEVTACVENLSTGEYEVYSFDSSETAMLPISCSAGEWQVTLTLESGAEYVGEFQI